MSYRLQSSKRADTVFVATLVLLTVFVPLSHLLLPSGHLLHLCSLWRWIWYGAISAFSRWVMVLFSRWAAMPWACT